jgi:hypothetical protein
VPLSIGNNVANFSERVFVGARDDDIWRTLRQPFHYADNLCARLTAAEDDFRKALTIRPRVVDASEADVFKVKILNAVDGFAGLQIAALVCRQELRQFVEIHHRQHATKGQTKHISENQVDSSFVFDSDVCFLCLFVAISEPPCRPSLKTPA